MQAKVISIKSVGVSHSYPALFSWAPDSTNQQTWSLSNAPSFFLTSLEDGKQWKLSWLTPLLSILQSLWTAHLKPRV